MLKPSARLFPIGYIISVDAPNFNPHDFYVDGNWERIKGKVIVGLDENQTEFNATGKTGGAKTHTLTVAEIPKIDVYGAISGTGGGRVYRSYTSGGISDIFNGTIGQVQGGEQPHNNLPPYQTAYVWKLISYSN